MTSPNPQNAQGSIEFPGPEQLKRNSLSLDLVLRYHGFVEALSNGAGKYSDVVTYLQNNGFAKWLEGDELPTEKVRGAVRGLARYLKCGRLTIQRGNGVALTPIGDSVAEWATDVLECLKANAAKKHERRAKIVVATHHIFEWSVLPAVLKLAVQDQRYQYWISGPGRFSVDHWWVTKRSKGE